MSTYYIELPSNKPHVVSFSHLRDMLFLPENVYYALGELLRNCFTMVEPGIYLPGFVYFTIIGNNIVSVAFVTCQDYCLIYNACTDSAYRRRGLMSQLLKAIISDLRNYHLYLQVEAQNVQAYRLYRKLGFSPVNITEKDNEEIITMQYVPV